MDALDFIFDNFFTIFIGMIVLGVIIGIGKSVKNNKNSKRAIQTFNDFIDFKFVDRYISDNSGLSISFDIDKKKICFLEKKMEIKESVNNNGKLVRIASNDFKSYIYDFDKILQCELSIDGNSVLKQSTASTLGRSLLGGALFGGIGGVVGGVTTSKSMNEKIKNIDLKIIINDTETPVFRINFLNIETKKGSLIYKNAYKNAEIWHGKIVGLMKNVDDKIIDEKQNPSTDNTEKLKRLFELKNIGALSDEEFQEEKKKILSSPIL